MRPRPLMRMLPILLLAVGLAIPGPSRGQVSSAGEADRTHPVQEAEPSCALGICVNKGQVSIGALIAGEGALIARFLGLGRSLRASLAALTASPTVGQALYPVLPFALAGAAGWFAWTNLPAGTNTQADVDG